MATKIWINICAGNDIMHHYKQIVILRGMTVILAGESIMFVFKYAFRVSHL